MGEEEKNRSLKQFCYSIATFGSLGEWPFGAVIASIFAIPLIFLFRSVFWFSQNIFYWVLFFSASACIIVVQAALQVDAEKARRAIVLDKIVGLMIALLGVQLRWRVVIFGLLLFHLLNTVKPFLWYKKILRYIELLPGVIGVFGADLLSGALVNVFLHLIAWVMG